MKRKQILTAVLAAGLRLSMAQQVADTAFAVPNPHPQYAPGHGPVVWLDEAHHNFHTLDGRYIAFGKVLRADGYDIQPNRQPFTPALLSGCKILVIANALDAASDTTWALPNISAFSPPEIEAIKAWVHAGGSLFLIADHMPFAGSAQDLARAFGVEYLNGFAMDNRRRNTEQFFRSNKTLLDAPVSRGIDTVVTFTGSAFRLPKNARPVLALRGYTILMPEAAWQFTEKTPHLDSKGLYQLGILQFGKGLVVVSGEAAMFSAQLTGPARAPVGMNSPEARQNGQLLLNIIHWLDNG